MDQGNPELIHGLMDQLGPRDNLLYTLEIVVIVAKAADQANVRFDRVRSESIT
jgi:hypothetical protein